MPTTTTSTTQLPSVSEIQKDHALLDQVLEVAVAASKKAGEIILGNAGGSEVTERKANSRDLLTLIDPLCEKVRADDACSRVLFIVDPPVAF